MLWRHVGSQVNKNVSEKRTVSIFSSGNKFISPKRYTSTSLHDNTTQNTHASCLGCPRFKSRRRGDRLSWLRFSWFSTVPPRECRDSTLKLGHDRFVPNPFQFIIRLSYHRHLVIEKASLNKLPTNEPTTGFCHRYRHNTKNLDDNVQSLFVSSLKENRSLL